MNKNNMLSSVGFDLQTLQLASILMAQAQNHNESSLSPLPRNGLTNELNEPKVLGKRSTKTSNLTETEKIKRRRLQIAAASRKSRAKRKEELQILKKENEKLTKQLKEYQQKLEPKIFTGEEELISFLQENIFSTLKQLKENVALKSGSTDKVFEKVEKTLLSSTHIQN